MTSRPHLSYTPILTPHLLPYRAGLCAPGRARARAQWDSRTARPSRTPSRCAHTLAWGSPQGEKTPLPSGATPLGAPPAIEERPRRPLHPCAQSSSVVTSLPLHRLDRAPTPRGRAPASLSPSTLGFSPFPCTAAERARRRGGEGGRRGKEEGGRVATAPRLGTEGHP
jgi:hypothetical protein